MTARDTFFSIVRSKVFGGSMTQSQVDGANAILDAWDKWAPDSDLRFIAYALATAYWETDRTLQPIAEYGHGHGHSYGVPTGPYHQSYYGRGFVQLTWLSNFEKATTKLQALGVLTMNENLVRTPDLAMRPDIAAPIMIQGMLQGWFTGRKLSDFFHESVTDFVSARTIINGHDHAAEIAHYAQGFFAALDAQNKAATTQSLLFTPGENGQSPGIAMGNHPKDA
jgi:putative chitinase